MTDNEIIKACETCACINGKSCEPCPYYVDANRSKCMQMRRDTLDLINRLQAKVDFMTKQRDTYMQEAAEFSKEIDRQKAEIERLKTLNSKLEEEVYRKGLL